MYYRLSGIISLGLLPPRILSLPFYTLDKKKSRYPVQRQCLLSCLS